jgi:hypothetical protein
VVMLGSAATAVAVAARHHERSMSISTTTTDLDHGHRGGPFHGTEAMSSTASTRPAASSDTGRRWRLALTGCLAPPPVRIAAGRRRPGPPCARADLAPVMARPNEDGRTGSRRRGCFDQGHPRVRHRPCRSRQLRRVAHHHGSDASGRRPTATAGAAGVISGRQAGVGPASRPHSTDTVACARRWHLQTSPPVVQSGSAPAV